MKLSELNEAERLALMALLKLIISADQKLSAAESRLLERVADDVGRETFLAARADAETKLKGVADLDAALDAVTRPEARALLYRQAFEAAEVDELIPDEIERLNDVAQRWEIAVDPDTGRPAA